METPTPRRKFLKTGCLVGAAAGLVVCGGGTLAGTYQPKIDLPVKSLGAPAQDNRVLVAYASRAGSTAEAAARIGETLAAGGAAVDVQPVSDRFDPAAYRAVVLGSAVRAGSILPEAMTFLQDHQTALQAIPFSVFILCLTLQTDSEANRQEASAYLDPVRALVAPAAEGLFAGAMDFSKLKLYERLIMLAMKSPRGDFRDWGKITEWAGTVGGVQ